MQTISSPGVQIFERDLSLVAPQNIGTNVFVTGFTNSGPTDEVLEITTLDELQNIYGIPSNSAERYFYYTIKELLNSDASIYTYRLPYGAGTGYGFGSLHTALVYPVVAATPTGLTTTTNLALTAGTYFLGAPVQVSLTDTEFAQALEGTLFNWSPTATPLSALTTSKASALTAMGGAGLIILDKAQTTINSQFEGYYVGIADNVNLNPATNFTNVINAYTVSLSADVTYNFTQIPNGTLQFTLSSVAGNSVNSISQVMENLTVYSIDGRTEDDLLNVGVFKLRKSLYATEAFMLDYSLQDAIVGSIDSFRTETNANGGPAIPFFLETQDINSQNVEILVNPYISNKYTQSSQDVNGLPLKKVRVLTSALASSTYGSVSAALGTTQNVLSAFSASGSLSAWGKADALFPLGAYTPVQITQKSIGDLPSKVARALQSVINDEVYDIDVVVEAGLGTVFTIASAAETTYYDDTLYTSDIKDQVDSLRTSNDISDDPVASNMRSLYTSIFETFENFCNLPSNTGGRGDCLFLADPLRHIYVTGKNTKVLSDKTRSFQTDVYWAHRHQMELANTSYAATYGNWVQVLDDFTGELVWMPFSGFQAAIIARSDAQEYPWSAPAGYNRGLLASTALDLAITPNQKQRDEFYKANINPVMFSASQGMVVFGQKTLSRKPSAFDRINVRRLFFALERPTKKAAMFFVFEPNNEFTQTRLINVLTPVFEYAKQNGGVYNYMLICDSRNNTPDSIDRNELNVDAFIQATKTGEFVNITFTATRTGANFSELI